MPYRHTYLSQGDPFGFPNLFGLAKKAIGAITGLGGGGASKKEIEQIMKDRLASGVGAASGAAKAVGKTIAKHPAAAAAAAAAGGLAVGGVIGHMKKDGTWSNRRRGHMQVGNTRALRRSMRRVQGFAHLASKTMTFVKHHRLKKHRRR